MSRIERIILDRIRVSIKNKLRSTWLQTNLKLSISEDEKILVLISTKNKLFGLKKSVGEAL
jgi:hypothetical protein